jgi:hypothetical protein
MLTLTSSHDQSFMRLCWRRSGLASKVSDFDKLLNGALKLSMLGQHLTADPQWRLRDSLLLADGCPQIPFNQMIDTGFAIRVHWWSIL